MQFRFLAALAISVALPVFAEDARPTPPTSPANPSPAASTAPKPTPSKKPDWQVKVGAANADGSRSVSATLLADAPIASGFGEVTPKLVIRYRSGNFTVFVVFDTFLGEGELPIDVTFGHETTETQRWTVSSDGRAAFAPGEALAWIERLKHAESLSLSFTPPHRDRARVTFTPRDPEALLKALLSAGVKYGS